MNIISKQKKKEDDDEEETSIFLLSNCIKEFYLNYFSFLSTTLVRLMMKGRNFSHASRSARKCSRMCFKLSRCRWSKRKTCKNDEKKILCNPVQSGIFKELNIWRPFRSIELAMHWQFTVGSIDTGHDKNCRSKKAFRKVCECERFKCMKSSFHWHLFSDLWPPW